MRIILKNIRYATESGQITDDSFNIYIENGIISDISQSAPEKDDSVIDCKNMICYPSWVDIGTSLNEPGHEERETLDQLESSALRGGYSDLITLPHTSPVVDNAAMVYRILSESDKRDINLHPIAALSMKHDGENIAELLELNEAGAVGFSDGYMPSKIPGFMLRSLDYVKAFGGIILSLPYDDSISPYGQIHEGKTSTMLGLEGIPAISETSRIQRDIELLKYTDSSLCVWNISSAESVEIIRKAKSEGLNVFCTVSYLHLIETDETLTDFDPFMKVLPPLREESDRNALIEACLDGTIDCITSQHRPWDPEHKLVEFPYAEFGTRSLQIVYAALSTFCLKIVKSERFIDLMCNNARKIFNLETNKIKKGNMALLSIVDPTEEWEMKSQSEYSSESQYSLRDRKLRGRVKISIQGNSIHKH